MTINLKDGKTDAVKNLIYEMLDILEAVGVPLDKSPRKNRSLEKMAMAVLAVGQIKTSFSEAKSSDDNVFLKTREIIDFENSNYSESISSGSYDDIRRKDLLLPVEALIVVRSASVEAQATNDPSRGYALSPAFVELIKNWDSPDRSSYLANYLSKVSSLKKELERRRDMDKVPVVLPNGVELELSAGEHNVLQKAIIEQFLPFFGMSSEVLYLGDTSDKYLYLNQDKLTELGYFVVDHDELPDVIAYSESKNVLFLIEAYHSTGQWSEIRLRKLKHKLDKCSARVIFVTAFETLKSFKQKSAEIAWETEVWIAENPEHMIHFNGFKFLKVYS